MKLVELSFKRNRHRAGWSARVWLFGMRRFLDVGWFHHDPNIARRWL